tara:strand:+ start:328 stop:528 length:201 start_codon:yes stop_codon:yes gene_type:complete
MSNVKLIFDQSTAPSLLSMGQSYEPSTNGTIAVTVEDADSGLLEDILSNAGLSMLADEVIYTDFMQ